MTPRAAVIVSTYEAPRRLDLVLAGLAAQSVRDFEAVVADDGSGPETAEVVRRWSGRVGARLAHVRHEDRGFRAAAIRRRRLTSRVSIQAVRRPEPKRGSRTSPGGIS